MKKIIGCLAFLLSVGSVAYAGDGAIPIMQVAASSITVAITSVNNTSVLGATQVDSPQMANRRAIEIQNIDSTANLWCLPVSTMPVANGGRQIKSGNSWIIGITNSVGFSGSPGVAAKIWCLSDGVGITKAVVTQLY